MDAAMVNIFKALLPLIDYGHPRAFPVIRDLTPRGCICMACGVTGRQPLLLKHKPGCQYQAWCEAAEVLRNAQEPTKKGKR
jgi:hypothetical protein